MADINISVRDFLDSCSESELQEIREYLAENTGFGYDNDKYNQAIEKLSTRRSELTNTEEQIILTIANRF